MSFKWPTQANMSHWTAMFLIGENACNFVGNKNLTDALVIFVRKVG